MGWLHDLFTAWPCFILPWHKVLVDKEFNPYSRRLKCQHCGKLWVMNDDSMLVLPWDEDFAKLYEGE